jgi:hypothetical protein
MRRSGSMGDELRVRFSSIVRHDTAKAKEGRYGHYFSQGLVGVASGYWTLSEKLSSGLISH